MSTSPDPKSLSRAQLTDRLRRLTGRETGISKERHDLHCEIDLLRRELVERMRREDRGQIIISGAEAVETDESEDG